MIGQLLSKRYRIIKILGFGGFSETYLATDERLYGRQCVVKKLVPQNQNISILQKSQKLFKQEAMILAKLGQHHDQIPDLIDNFTENNDFYIVQEFIDGNSLHNEFIAINKLQEIEVIDFLKDVLTVLNFVHENNVIHRDIKPANLIRRYKDGKIVLIDFGLIKQVHSQLINPQVQAPLTVGCGTLGYRPEEQKAGMPVFNSDIYALGMTAIEAVTGIRPDQIQLDFQTGEVSWHHLAPEISDRTKAVIDKMVRSRYTERYQTVNEVLKDIEILQTPLASTQIVNHQVNLQNQQTYLQVNRAFSSSVVKSGKKKIIKLWYVLFLLFIIAIGGGIYVFLNTELVFSRNQAVELLDIGDELLNLRRYEAAVQSYSDAIKINPNYAEAFNGRGFGRYNLRMFSEALADYNQALLIRPNFVEALNNRGILFVNLQQYDQALRDFNQAVSIQANNAEVLNNRGWTLHKLGRNQEAIRDFQTALQLNPNFESAKHNLQSVQRNLRRNN